MALQAGRFFKSSNSNHFHHERGAVLKDSAMKMRSPIPKKHARIEIIPLIDIMFFLLASFMMVSLSQTHMKGIPVNLPSNQPQPPQDPNKKDYVAIRVTEGGLIYFDNAPVL